MNNLSSHHVCLKFVVHWLFFWVMIGSPVLIFLRYVLIWCCCDAAYPKGHMSWVINVCRADHQNWTSIFGTLTSIWFMLMINKIHICEYWQIYVNMVKHMTWVSLQRSKIRWCWIPSKSQQLLRAITKRTGVNVCIAMGHGATNRCVSAHDLPKLPA